MKSRDDRKTVSRSQKRRAKATSFVITEVKATSEEDTSQSSQQHDRTFNTSTPGRDDTQSISSDDSAMELQDVNFGRGETALEESFVETEDPSSSPSHEAKGSKKFAKKRKHQSSESQLNDSVMSLDSSSSVTFEQESANNFKVHIVANTQIYFHGKLSIKVLQGHVQVLGWDMFEGDEQQIYSPRGSSLLGIETYSLASIIQLNSFDSHLTASLGALTPHQLFSAKKESTNVLPSARVKIQAERYLDCRFMKKSLDAKVTTISQEWKQVLMSITQAASFYDNTRAILCGGKSVGKSTFLRVLTNSILSKQMGEIRGVLVLDLDPGQSEFTPPGCLAAVLVKQPLLGPGYTQQLCPERMMFLGQIDVSQCVRSFKSAVRELANYCNKHHKDVPWIVNTMGFNTGIGVELLRDVLRIICSDTHAHVVEIQSTDWKRNYAPDMWNQQLLSSLVHYPIPSVVSAKGKQQQQQWSLQPKQQREISLLAYLSPALQLPDFSLLSNEPYMIKLDTLTLGVVHMKVAPWCILRALQGNLVGLCYASNRIKGQATRPKDRPGPAVLRQPEALPCYGYGVVCGIDMSAGQLYVQTPEPKERLAQVNCLLLGAIQLPQILRTTGDTEGPVPYVSCGKSHSTSGPVRRFYRPLASLTSASR